VASAPDCCVFCEIVAGRTPASLIYEDQVCLVLVDINPVNSGHALVIPKRHAAYLADLDEETGAHLFRVTMRLAQAIRKSGLRCEGINVLLADGEAAFQEVFHVHLHVLPRFQGDPFRIEADWSIKPPREELDRVAHQIRTWYEGLWGSQ
jgi:diadenosine tetraphosphate (Ap4A) HIT family hydrolase